MALPGQSRTSRKHGGARIALLAVACASALLSASAAMADARLCLQLEAQLAGASRGGSNAKARRYDAAIARQGNEIAKARARARQSGCLFGLLGSGCGPMNDKIRSMQANLASLERQRAGMGGGSTRERNRILAAIDRNGCRSERTAERRSPKALKERERTVLDQASGGKAGKDGRSGGSVDPGANIGVRVLQPGGGGLRLSGSYRTYCVRTCDGYFFPMSPASTQRDFFRDQQNCESACPGTDMRVYFRRDHGDDPAGMMSAMDEAPYSELPAAFAWRKGPAQDLTCGCRAGAAAPSSVVSSSPAAAMPEPVAPGQALEAAPQSSSVVVLQPPAPPQPASNPTDEDAVQRMLRRKEAEKAGGDRKVRVVGPTFLPDPGEAIDLRAPVPAPGP